MCLKLGGVLTLGSHCRSSEVGERNAFSVLVASFAVDLGRAHILQDRPEIVQCPSLTMPIAGLLQNLCSVLQGCYGIVESLHFLQDRAEVVERFGLAVPVAGFLKDLCSVLQGCYGIVESLHFLQRDPEVSQCPS